MAEVWSGSSKMGSNNQDDSPETSRERRRRRIEMRRIAIAAAGGSSSSSYSLQSSSCASSITSEETAINVAQVAGFRVPVVGAMSVPGRLRDMEDAITVRTSLCRPEINLNQPVHFFGVFDGHGGPHVAAMCRLWMHVIFEQEVMSVGNITAPRAGGASNPIPPPEITRRALWRDREEAWRRVMKTSFLRMNEVATATSYRCGVPEKCSCQANDVELSGSTAVVAILTREYIIISNCGDSRAVLCRGGSSIPLSTDHKPDRDEERARIEASGGRVIFNNGARVEGILAMSRSIGDQYLKPIVTPEPEIFFRKRDPEDECLILGSDGLWDVLTNTMAGQVARECLTEATAEESSTRPWRSAEWNDELFPTRSASAAGLLTRLALGRNSYGNISVIVVDLKRTEIQTN